MSSSMLFCISKSFFFFFGACAACGQESYFYFFGLFPSLGYESLVVLQILFLKKIIFFIKKNHSF